MKTSEGKEVVLAIGGGTPYDFTPEVEVYDISQDKWEDGDSITKENNIGTFSYQKDTRALVFLSRSNGIYEYDPVSKVWSKVATHTIKGNNIGLIQFQF